MTRLLTKADRDQSRAYQFDSLTQKGYIQTTYKNLVVFHHPTDLLLKSFWGTAANHTDFFKYRSIEQLLQKVEQLKANADSREQYAAEQKERNKGKKSSHAAASAAIRQELKKAFPHTNFSVRSESYAGGDSVRVSWDDGPTSAEVEAISGKYQYGSFDGMEDIYKYTNSRDDIPQTKYVSESRGMSDETKAVLQPIAEALFESFKREDNDRPYNCWDAPQFLHRIFANVSFMAGAKATGIIRTPETCGINNPEVFYTISFDLSAVKETSQPQAQERPEIAPGKVQIVAYSEKSVAVIGETYPIRAKLKELGGRFNKFLSCGAGWIFPVTQLEELKQALTKPKEEPTLKDEIGSMVNLFAEIDLKTKGEISESTRQIADVQEVEIYDNLPEIEEAARGGKMISLYNLSTLVNRRAHV